MSTSSPDRVRDLLVGLKMARSLEVLDTIVGSIEQKEISALEAIETLLSEELSMRESRRVRISPKTARLTRIKTLDSLTSPSNPASTRRWSGNSRGWASWNGPRM
jgi:hypothetical protein